MLPDLVSRALRPSRCPDREVCGRRIGCQHDLAAAVVARGHGAGAAEAGGGVDRGFDRAAVSLIAIGDRVSGRANQDVERAGGSDRRAVTATVPVVRPPSGGLLRLLHRRQRLLQQAGDAGEAVGGRVDRLLALADLVEQALNELAVLVRFCEVK